MSVSHQKDDLSPDVKQVLIRLGADWEVEAFKSGGEGSTYEVFDYRQRCIIAKLQFPQVKEAAAYGQKGEYLQAQRIACNPLAPI